MLSPSDLSDDEYARVQRLRAQYERQTMNPTESLRRAMALVELEREQAAAIAVTQAELAAQDRDVR